MRNTIRKVTIVVPVLIRSCQVSLYPNNGPVTPDNDGEQRETESDRVACHFGYALRKFRKPREQILHVDLLTANGTSTMTGRTRSKWLSKHVSEELRITVASHLGDVLSRRDEELGMLDVS